MINFYGKSSCIRSRKRKIKAILKIIATEHQFKISSINYIFVDDKELLDLNIAVLKHNYYTDIITFDYTENEELEGEIYISIDRVKENARIYNQEFHVELLRVIIHGVLHMVGYSDKTKSKQAKMRRKEDFYINKHKELFHVEQTK
jgi:probable rRNA maturation factor